ncbi:uncharacterized protein EI90DRAFT_3059524, partial [Cantharellus anzutake]|uniref:uncharacterized protein n=1 Tax=Cantharellus anzutake TaxID=1750568 RepID=UPI001908F776
MTLLASFLGTEYYLIRRSVVLFVYLCNHCSVNGMQLFPMLCIPTCFPRSCDSQVSAPEFLWACISALIGSFIFLSSVSACAPGYAVCILTVFC